MPVIGVIEGSEIYLEPLAGGLELVEFLADADEDNDGSGGNPEHDPYHQDDTSLHDPFDRPLNPYTVPYIVVPPLICERTKGIVLGSLCECDNILNNLRCHAVVGDIGPRNKIGEMSPACARNLGLHITAFRGESRRIIKYRIFVGQPAVINGVAYRLKPYR